VAWQAFIDNNPTSPDLDKAKAELAKWQKLADSGAEKIGGAWVGGEELKTMVEAANKLTVEGLQLLDADQSVKAMHKFEEAVKTYPNAYAAQMFLGVIDLLANKLDDAAACFTKAQTIRPDSWEPENNLGIVLCQKKQLAEGIEKLRLAAEAVDEMTTANNLVKALSLLTPEQRKNANYKTALETARLLAARFHLDRVTDWTKMPYRLAYPTPDKKPGEESLPSGVAVSGTGFIIQEDGLVLTNRHVVDLDMFLAREGVAPAPGAANGGIAKARPTTLLVLLPDGKKASAELVAVDPNMDLALIRIKGAPNTKYPTIALSKTDTAETGAPCFAVGFPMLTRLGQALKVTQGIISGAADGGGGVDILIDAKVNPGNSGGPLVDKFGQVMGVVSMKSIGNGMEDSYGMAISAGHVRAFLKANKVTLAAADPGKPLGSEEVVAHAKPATVCIIAAR
jgi:S1-C subfamily serine protease